MILLQAHSLTKVDGFQIANAPMTLGEKDSSLSFEVGPEAPKLSPGQWLMDDEDPGRGIVWRVRSVVDNYGTGMRTVACEHIIQALKDTSLFGEVTTGTLDGNADAETCTALQAIQYALGRQTDWVMRAEDFGYANVRQPYSFNGENILQALETVCGTLEDCWWSYDLSVHPFRLKILPRDTTMGCEMREGRNISSIKRTIDAGGMYTRIYPIGKNNLHITGDYISRNEDVCGVIMKVETDQSCETEGMLRAWAEGRLRRHCQPNVSIQISGLDLSRETGEPLDKLQMGRACRVPLPEYSTNILENIVKMQWRDKKKEPENVTLTLSNTVADVASIVKQERSEGGGSSGRASRYGAKKAEEDHAWFVDTTDHVSMVAEAIVGKREEAVNWSRVSELEVGQNGIYGHVTQAEQDIIANQAAIEINERNISLTVKSRQIPNDRLHGYTSKASFPATGTSGHYYYYETGSGSSAKRYYFRWNGSEYIPAHVFTGLDGNLYGNYVNAGEIAVAVNEAGETEAHIDAKKVILGQSKLTADDLESWAKDPSNNGGVFAKFIYAKKIRVNNAEVTGGAELAGLLVTGNSEFTGGIYANGNVYSSLDGSHYFQGTELRLVSTGGGSQGVPTMNLTYANLKDMLVKASVDSGTLKIWKYGDAADAPSVTFSKATSLTLAWSGGKVTATGTPAQTPALTKSSELSESYDPSGNVIQCNMYGTADSSGKYVKQGVTVKYKTGETDPNSGEDVVLSTGRTLQVVMDASAVYDTGANKNRASQVSGYFTSNKTPAATLAAGTTYEIQTQYQKADGTWGNGGSVVLATPAAQSTTTYVNPPASALHVDPIGWYGSEPNTDATAPTIGSYVQNHSSGWVRFDVYLDDGYGGARKSYRFKIG